MSPVLFLSYGLSTSHGLRERRNEIHTRDFKNQLRRGQRERQKTIGFNKQNNNFARGRFFAHFFARFCTTTRWKCLISRFTEYENKHRRNFISIPELGYGA